jgi:hypothetical protein
MTRLPCYVTCVFVVWCVSISLPGSGSAAPSRPDGQAIQFQVGYYFTLSNFDGTTLGYQRFIRRDVAWRVSVGADIRHDSGETSEQQTGATSFDGSGDISERSYAITLASELLRYRGDRVSVYYGGGPRISYTSGQSESWAFYVDEERFTRYTDTSYGVGLQGCIGIQWAAVDWLALHAEYHARFTYEHIVDEYERTETGEYPYSRTETVKTDRFFLDSRGVRFGLSAYF